MIVLPIFETQNGDNLVDNPMTIIPLHIVSYHSPTVMAQIGGPVQAPCAHLCRPQRLNVQLCPNWRDYKQPFTDQTIAMENTPENGIVEDTGYILDDMSQGSTLNQFDMH
ncbi:hypothetical protein BLOT_014179 [Blomia tropicalis]|nr:hypothetical protein BLOT_014179 [Blomia tropicalis]